MELTHNPALLWYVIGYIVIIVGIGYVFSKKVSNTDDFMLAGRTLGSVILMGTLIATWVGSGTVTGGSTSIAYQFGLGPAILNGLGATLGILVLFAMANKIRSASKYTLSGALEEKYGTVAKILASVIIILAFVGIVSYQFTGLGMVLNAATGLPIETGTIIAAVIVIILATLGGLMSVAPTDALSAFIILIGLIIGIPYSIAFAGGWSELTSQVPASKLTLLGELNLIQLLGYIVPSLFLLLGDQNMYQRIASSKGNKESRMGIIGMFIGVGFVYPAVSIIGFASSATFPDIRPGMAFIAITTVLPDFIGGLLLAAVTAFIITTGSSYLLSAATNITMDIYGNYINPKSTSKQKLVFTRILIPVLGVLSYVLIQFFPTILEAQMYAYTVYAAGITPAILGVYLWGDRVTKQGGISSMISGVIVTLFFEFSNILDFHSAVISVPIAILVLIVVTLMTTNKVTNKEMIDDE
ncbi:sodium:solute symporter family protein [Natranaerobius trueperi]|uniref:Sodium:proline symporter n=1 Tax=Natranaerobius trueperi TaxID=759412 RepID=A0A226BVC3_9FIRM|nr:sodium:solute symporter family protein [Natranaerobius trueperi]OWZ82831.1 sodium:proline symporter [Natranaerobius trueperi]